MSLSYLWLPGAKQGAFPSVQLRDLRPSLHLCSTHGLTTQVFFLSSFPREGLDRPWPPWASGHRAHICHCRSKQNGHSIPQGSARAYGLAGPMYSNGPRQNALRLLLRRPSLSRVRAARPPLCSGSGLARQPSTVGVAFPGRRSPVQGRASALLSWTPHAWWRGLGLAQRSGNSQRVSDFSGAKSVSFLTHSLCADLVFSENHSCSLVCPA